MADVLQGAPTVKVITCILPPGITSDVLARLRHEKGIVEAHVRAARGLGKLTPARYRKAGSQTEKEILSVIVSAEGADELFEWLFHETRIDRPHGGILYMNSLMRATPYVLPHVPEEA
jgi:hypothetical protein